MYHFFPHRYPSVLGTYINIVKDVVDIAVVHMSTDKFVSWLAYITFWLMTKVHDVAIALTTKENPSRVFTEHEMFDMLRTLVSPVISCE